MVPVNSKNGPAVAQTPMQRAQQENQSVPPKLTACGHHIPQPMPPVQQMHLSFDTRHQTPQVCPPSPPIDPVLLEGQGGLQVSECRQAAAVTDESCDWHRCCQLQGEGQRIPHLAHVIIVGQGNLTVSQTYWGKI